MQVIPLIPNPNQSLHTLLDNQEVTLRVYQRNSSLYIDISKDNEPICYGQKCVFGRSVMSFSPQLLKGSFHFMDIEAKSSPEYTGLNSRYYLIYLGENESMPEAFKW